MYFFRITNIRLCQKLIGLSATVFVNASSNPNNPDLNFQENRTRSDGKKFAIVSHAPLTDEQRNTKDRQHQAVTAGVMNNPAVTLGLVLTVCALVGMMRKTYTGDRVGAQRFMQYRIMAQFFTLLALIAGVGYFSMKFRSDEEK